MGWHAFFPHFLRSMNVGLILASRQNAGPVEAERTEARWRFRSVQIPSHLFLLLETSISSGLSQQKVFVQYVFAHGF